MHPQVSLFYVEMRECFVFALQILYHQLFHHHGVAVQPQWCTQWGAGAPPSALAQHPAQ